MARLSRNGKIIGRPKRKAFGELQTSKGSVSRPQFKSRTVKKSFLKPRNGSYIDSEEEIDIETIFFSAEYEINIQWFLDEILSWEPLTFIKGPETNPLLDDDF